MIFHVVQEGTRFFRFVTSHKFDIRTDGQTAFLWLDRVACIAVKTSSLGSTTHHPLAHIAHKTSILGQEVLKIHANINNPTSALNVCELTKCCTFEEIGV